MKTKASEANWNMLLVSVLATRPLEAQVKTAAEM